MIPADMTLELAAAHLDAGRWTSRALVDAALAAVAADGTAFTRIDPAAARDAAARSDERRREGRLRSPYDGVPISVKDLFDVAGQPTPAGSALRRGAPAATTDAPAIARLRAAGLILIGRTHMSEFAFTGLGLNPHAPPLSNPIDPARAPGGSSGGAAASVARGQALAGLGTDTGGSVRIPAAFCGLAGFKPTQRRVSRDGVFPLSPTLDSVGPIARTVACCRTIDALISDRPVSRMSCEDLSGVVIGVPENFVLEDADGAVADAFALSLQRLETAGARLRRFRFKALDAVAAAVARGAVANAEAYALHRRLGHLEAPDQIDPEVLRRILVGREMTAADYLDLLEARAAIRREADAATDGFDLVAAPTTPAIAPKLEDLKDPGAFQRLNALALRNPSVVNFLDRCAVSLPMETVGPAPSGLMLIGPTLSDERTLALAAAAAAAAARL